MCKLGNDARIHPKNTRTHAVVGFAKYRNTDKLKERLRGDFTKAHGFIVNVEKAVPDDGTKPEGCDHFVSVNISGDVSEDVKKALLLLLACAGT